MALSRRKLTITAGTAAGAWFMAACGAAGGTQTTTNKAKVTGTVLFWTGGAGDAEMSPKRVADFMAEYPNIKVTMEDPGDLAVKVPTAAAAGTLGDIMLQSTSAGQPQVFFLRKIVAPLDEFVTREKFDLKQYFPHIISAAHVDGKLFALPFDAKVARVAVWINRTMFQKAGLALPDIDWTVDKYMDAAVKLTRADAGEWGMATNFKKDFSYVQAMVRRWGGDVLDASGKKATMDTPQAQAAFQWAYDMYHTRRVADPAQSDETKTFFAGKGAIMLHRDFNQKPNAFAAAKAQGFDLFTSIGPKGPTGRRGGFWDFRAAWMPVQSKQKDATWEFMKWITNKESGLAHALQSAPGTSTTPGARPDIFTDPRFLNHPTYPRQVQEMEAESMKSDEPENFPANYQVDEMSKVLNPYVDKIIKNEAQPNPALMRQINDDVQRVLNLPREGG